MTQITDHLANIHSRTANALAASGRVADQVMLLAVSKQQPAAAIEEAYRAGQRHFAENFLQESLAKIQTLSLADIQWHFIGRIQSNKTRSIAEHFQWVHTVDRPKIAARLNEQRPHSAAPLNVLIQVNQGDEQQKAGVSETEVADLARLILAQPRLNFRGLMSIPPQNDLQQHSSVYFQRLQELKIHLTEQGIPVDYLSMGMSADFESALANGSNCIRIGTGIFGQRVN